MKKEKNKYKSIVFITSSLLFGFFSYLSYLPMRTRGILDDYQSTFAQCVDSRSDFVFLIPLFGSIALLVIFFFLRPSWRAFFVTVVATLLAVFICDHFIKLPCWGLENGTGG